MLLENQINIDTILLFDLDNTLIYTDYTNFLSYKKAIEETTSHIVDFSSTKRITRNSLEKLIPTLNQQEYENIISLKNRFYMQYLSETIINKSVFNLLLHYSKIHQTILLTNAHKERANELLKYHNLSNLFTYKFYKEDYSKDNKFEYILNVLKISPNSVIVFENEQLEIEKAISAKIPNKNIIRI